MTILHDDRPDRAPSDQVTPIRWAEFAAELRALYTPPMCAKATGSKMRAVLRELDALGVQTTADLTPVLISRYIAMRPEGQSPHTLHSLLTVIRSICSYAETAGYLRCSPFRLRKMSRWVRLPALTGKRHYSREEIRRVLELAAKDVAERTAWAQWRARRTQCALAIVAYTGMRKNECLRLHVGDVDLPAQAIWIRPHGENLKTSASCAPVPMPSALVKLLDGPDGWLAHRLDGPVGVEVPDCDWLIPTVDRKHPWVSGQPGGKALDRLQKLSARAGVPGMTWKGLRASLATHLEPVAGPALIQRILRHTNVRTSEIHYRKADIPNLVAALDGFNFD